MEETTLEYFNWTPACVLHVFGPDTFTFLQGQFSQDLRGANEKTAIYGLWLDQKGKIVADSYIWRENTDSFFVLSYAGKAETIFARLDAYLIADEVELEDVTSGFAGIWGRGQMDVPADEPLIELPQRRSAGDASEWVGQREQVEAWTREWAATARALDATELAGRRIAAGIPEVPVDAGAGDLPQEAGLAEVAVSFNKGCYLGQEVMARLAAMGQVRRSLRRVRGFGLATSGDSLWQAGRERGEVRSVVARGNEWRGLAMIKLTGLREKEPLFLGSPSGPEVFVEEET